jgi:hypothetical protein
MLCLLASQSRGGGGASASTAKLPSPTLAAALLSPAGGGQGFGFGFGGGNLLLGLLIAIVTINGMVYVRLPLCITVALTLIEVGTRLNNFFTLLQLPPTPLSTGATATAAASSGGRRTVAKIYAGESRLIAVNNHKSPQDFSHWLMRLCIDTFDPYIGGHGRPP